MTAANFFSKEEKEQIKAAVQTAELNTSGEIRVHIDNHCKAEVMDRAAWWFGKLEMRKTEQTSQFLDSLGPFFVGRVAWQSPKTD